MFGRSILSKSYELSRAMDVQGVESRLEAVHRLH